MYQETQGKREFSLSELPPGVELQTICLELPWLGTFAVDASVLPIWRDSVDASAETAGRLIFFPIDWFDLLFV